jgi:hypothetical protein
MSFFSSLPIAGIANAIGNVFGSAQKTKDNVAQQRNIQSSVKSDRVLYGKQVQQIAAQAGQQKGMRAIQAEQQMGALNAMLADTGVVGNTHAALRNQILGDMGIDQQTITTNASQALEQAQASFESRMRGYESQNNQVQSSAPSPVGSFLSNLAGFLPDKSGNKMTVGDVGGFKLFS